AIAPVLFRRRHGEPQVQVTVPIDLRLRHARRHEQAGQQEARAAHQAGTTWTGPARLPGQSPPSRNASNAGAGIAFAIRKPWAWSQPMSASQASASAWSTPSAVTW